MKKLSLLVTISVFSIISFANSSPKSHSPRVYLTMKKGKLVEVNNGRRKVVKNDVTLLNLTTIHPNGAIDASSGQSLQLKEGEYMTMDGRIRKYLLDRTPFASVDHIAGTELQREDIYRRHVRTAE